MPRRAGHVTPRRNNKCEATPERYPRGMAGQQPGCQAAARPTEEERSSSTNGARTPAQPCWWGGRCYRVGFTATRPRKALRHNLQPSARRSHAMPQPNRVNSIEVAPVLAGTGEGRRNVLDRWQRETAPVEEENAVHVASVGVQPGSMGAGSRYESRVQNLPAHHNRMVQTEHTASRPSSARNAPGMSA